MTAELLEDTGCVLDGDRFAALVGVRPDHLPAACRADLQREPLHYEVCAGRSREEHLLRALRESDLPELRVAGPHRAADWERGWGENLREFEAAGLAPQALLPKYNRHRVLRLAGDYVQVADPRFEYAVYTALRHVYFARWFGGLARVVEFGCGTGTSLLQLAETFPHLQLCGLDWAESSQQILRRLGERLGRPIEAHRFDMFQPAGEVALGAGTGVFTSAAMEQLGTDHGALLDYVLAGRPEVCVHFEPIFELYAEDSLFDEVARRYHLRRNYLRGFLPRLRELQAQGRIELLEVRRTGFGSFFHEGYSVVVWRPTGGGSQGAR